MKKAWVVIFVFPFLLACGSEALHHGLVESEADEVLVKLYENGINAKKEKEIKGQDVSWKVVVDQEELAKARHILVSNNLPRRKEMGLSGVYQEKGLIPTPDEQKARYLLALKGEIINSLRSIPGVVDADVILNIPKEDEFSDPGTPKKRPTASVVIKTRNEAAIVDAVTEAKVQRFVSNTIPNLHDQDVAVILTRLQKDDAEKTPAVATVDPNILIPEVTSKITGSNTQSISTSLPSTPSEKKNGEPVQTKTSQDLVMVAGLGLSPDSVSKFKTYTIILLLALVFVSFALMATVLKMNQMRRAEQALLASPASSGLGVGSQEGLPGSVLSKPVPFSEGGQGEELQFDEGNSGDSQLKI